MSSEAVRQLGLAFSVIWVPVASQYALALVEGRPANSLSKYVTYGGVPVQLLACVVAPVLFPSTVCFTAVAIELVAMIGVVYSVRKRRKGKVSHRNPGRLLAFIRRHGILICAMIGGGASFIIYMTPLL